MWNGKRWHPSSIWEFYTARTEGRWDLDDIELLPGGMYSFWNTKPPLIVGMVTKLSIGIPSSQIAAAEGPLQEQGRSTLHRPRHSEVDSVCHD